MSQLVISRMPKMRAIPQLVSAPLNPIPIAEQFRRSHPPYHFQCFFFFISRSTLKPQNSITSEPHCLKTHFSRNRKPRNTLSVFKLTIRATCVFLVKSKKLKKSRVRIDRNWARMRDRLWYETTENVF